ncbi:hypothetical protein GGF44_005021, partial [Coemansia sp. RSA 1694]
YLIMSFQVTIMSRPGQVYDSYTVEDECSYGSIMHYLKYHYGYDSEQVDLEWVDQVGSEWIGVDYD